MPAVHVAGLWRYPVKSLAGEALPVAELTHDGLAGDRLVHVRDGTGPLTGRTRSGLLTLPATTGTDGVPLVDGHRWDTATALALVRERAGAGASLAAYDGPERFDITNLLVATDGAVAHLGHDVRRLRPNLLVGGVGPAEEATWRGRALRIGSALVGIDSARQRCIVTSIDPDRPVSTFRCASYSLGRADHVVVSLRSSTAEPAPLGVVQDRVVNCTVCSRAPPGSDPVEHDHHARTRINP